MRLPVASPVEAHLPATATSFEEEFQYVYRTFRRMGSPPAEAEDLAQDVFVVACRRWNDFQTDRPLRPWLAGIAYRVGIDHARKHRRREIAMPEVHLEDEGPALDDQVSSARARNLALQALTRIPERYRAVLVRHHVDGASIRQIAEESSTPFSTVAARLRRGRIRFTKAVKQLQLGGRRLALIPSLLRSPLVRVMAGLGAASAVAALVLALATGRQAGLALSTRSPGAVPPSGAVGRWSFDDAPGSGVARDSSGNGRACRLHDLDARTAWVPGVRGGALDLGETGWLECPMPRARAGVPLQLSAAMWIKEGERRRYETVLFTRQLTSADEERKYLFWFGLYDHALMVRSSDWSRWTSSEIPPPQAWTHVAFVHDGEDTRLYVDGALVRHTTHHLPRAEGVVDSALTIGAMRFTTDPDRVRHHFDGLVDEAVIYDRALTDAEVAALARPGP